jgi:hypothetical protein
MSSEEWIVVSDHEQHNNGSGMPFTPINPSINKCNYFVNNANQVPKTVNL